MKQGERVGWNKVRIRIKLGEAVRWNEVRGKDETR